MSKVFDIDIAANSITFKDARLYQTAEKTWVPSVTTILEAYPKGPEFYEWMRKHGEDAIEIRNEAGRRGTNVHKMTEDYDNGLEVCLLNDFGNPSCSMLEWAMFERYVQFRKKSNASFDFVESTLSSSTLGFAGTIDRVGTIDGKRWLLDIKTSNSVQESYWLQLAAYRHLLYDQMDIAVDGVGIIWLNAKTRTEGRKDAIQGPGWQLITKVDTAQHYKIFQNVQQVWLAQNEDAKPKEFSYSLKHKL